MNNLTENAKTNKKVLTEYFDSGYCLSITKNIFSKIGKYYFRSKFVGFEKTPERNRPDVPIILASNHSGMAFPWDAITFASGLLEYYDYDFKKCVRPLTAPMLSESRLMCPYCTENLWKRMGCVDATMLNFETMMQDSQTNVLIYPEGVPGIAKGFNRRYQLQRFSTSFIRMSIKHKTDIIPFASINAEYIHPYSYKLDIINKLIQKIGIPFLPVSPVTLLILFQPWIFYLGFPAHLTYVRGKRIKPYEMTDQPIEKIRKKELRNIRDIIQKQMQDELNEAVKEYGKKPYEIVKYFHLNLKNIRKLPFYAQSSWAFLFTEFERLYQKKLRERSTKPVVLKTGFLFHIRTILKNPSVLIYYLPVLGLLFLFLKGLKGRKPS
jgi:1-acyl-sn-glycerol-3-phosphate acyltransferase